MSLFKERLDIDPAECKLLLTEAPMNPTQNREKMAQIMFEQYGFHSIYVAVQVNTCLYTHSQMSFRPF